MSRTPDGGERTVLVHLHLQSQHHSNDLQEFRELALSAGAEIVAIVTGSRNNPEAKYFAGVGKVEQIREIAVLHKANLVIFDHSLTPAQERNLERILKCRVIDRTGLILDIFAKRARSYEGKLQVELAQLKHHVTRLIRGWTHLERQKGGIGLRGPGETQLEFDRRLIRNRIKHLTAKLEKVRNQRNQGRRLRKRASIPTVSLVGYTNAGKSTLFNALTGANAFVANQLFATLDPTLRTLELPPIGKVIIADTVGFVSKLPHDLVEAFKATLEETQSADLLLHVIDVQNEFWRAQANEVEEVLEQIEASTVPRIEVFNKIDLLINTLPQYERNEAKMIHRVWVSGAKGVGLEYLKDAITEHLGQDLLYLDLVVPPEQAKLRAIFFERGNVKQEAIDEQGNYHLNIVILRIHWLQLSHEMPMLLEYLKPHNSGQ